MIKHSRELQHVQTELQANEINFHQSYSKEILVHFLKKILWQFAYQLD